MILSTHGGHCCGMKQLWGFTPNPTQMCPALPAPAHGSADYNHQAMVLRRYLVNEGLPSESGHDRLKRYLDFILKQKGCCVEAVIKLKAAYGDQAAWEPALVEAGFQKVQEFVNSNTMNVLGVYHLVVKDGKIDKPVAKKEAICEEQLEKSVTTTEPKSSPLKASAAATGRRLVSSGRTLLRKPTIRRLRTPRP